MFWTIVTANRKQQPVSLSSYYLEYVLCSRTAAIRLNPNQIAKSKEQIAVVHKFEMYVRKGEAKPREHLEF